MKIKSIHIQNFRQYRDFKIEFEINNNKKNITIIRAANSTGKTTFMQAIKWCLFGDSEIDSDKAAELLNYDELDECRRREIKDSNYRIVIEVIENNSTFKIARTQNLHITPSMVKKMEMLVALEYKDEDGQTKILRNSNKEKEELIQRKINSLLSKQMVNYFLFDGERIEKLSSRGTAARREVSEAIRAVSSLPILSNSIDTLQIIAKDVRKELARSASSEEYKEIEMKISRLEERLNEQSKQLEVTKETYENLMAEKEKVDKELSSIEDVTKIQEKRNKLDKENKKLIEENNTLYNNIQVMNMEYTTLKYIYLLKNKYQKINLKNNDEVETIPKMQVAAIEKIIDNGICICGTPLENHHIQTLNRQKNYQPPASEESMIHDYQMSVTREVSKIDMLVKQINEKINRYREIFEQIAENNKDLKDINNKLNNSSINEIVSLNKNRENLKRDIEASRFDITSTNMKIKDLEDELDKERLKYDEIESKLMLSLELKTQSILLEKSLIQLNHRKQKDEENLRADIEKAANNHFKNIISKEKYIKIDNNFNLKVFESENVEAVTSSGESVAVSISIILAIIDTYKANLMKNDKYELLSEKDFFVVMDGPFAMLDPYFSKQISSKISQSIEQIILLTNDNQYNESIKDAFRQRTSKEYLLEIPPYERKNSIYSSELREVEI